MYTPTPGDVHVNTPLTQVSIAYLQNQTEFVAAQVCPIIPVTKQSDRYYVYNRGDFFRDQMQRRAPGTPAASVGYRLDNTPTYFADVWAEAKPIPDQLRGNADAVLNMDRDAVEFLSQQALIRREKIFAANLFTTGKWNTDMTGVAAGPAAGQFLQWNDPASNPIEDIRAGKLAIKQATGYPANSLVLSEPVWLKLIDHPDLVDRVKYGQTAGRPATVSREALAAILELDRILVMGKASGRTNFGQMLAYLQKHLGTCRTILVEKTDRLYRNLTDYATVDELGVTIHLVKENQIIGPDSRSSEQFVHGIKVLVARNYSQNLGEETVKGMTEKARAGIYPSCAPVGYRNADGPSGKRVIVSDPDAAPMITELFGRFATGRYSLKVLVKEVNGEGLKLRGRKLYSSVVHQILRKRLYTGDFDWDGSTYTGSHEPLVTRECWQRVQELLDARAENKTRKVKHDFAYTGLVHCGHCGCLFVGELKKRKYVYYHCTGNRGKCEEPYTRQEILAREFAEVLQELVIPQAILEWLGNDVLTSDQTEQATRAQAIKKLQARHEQIQARIETMYLDKLDGRITQEFFDRQSAACRAEQAGLQRKIQDVQNATPAPIDQAVDMLSLTSRASELFLQQPAAEQRRLLQVVVEKADWQDGALRTTLFEPFEILRHSNQESYRKEKENGGSGRDLGIWLPR